jgi:hypothetical protein
MRIETLPLAAAEQLCRALSQRKACQTLEMIAITSESEALRENSAKPFDSNNVSFTVCRCDVRASTPVGPRIYLDNDLPWQAVFKLGHTNQTSGATHHVPRTVTFWGYA